MQKPKWKKPRNLLFFEPNTPILQGIASRQSQLTLTTPKGRGFLNPIKFTSLLRFRSREMASAALRVLEIVCPWHPQSNKLILTYDGERL